MEELLYYVIDDNNNVIYSGDYQDCKETVLEADYPLYLISELEFNNLNK